MNNGIIGNPLADFMVARYPEYREVEPLEYFQDMFAREPLQESIFDTDSYIHGQYTANCTVWTGREIERQKRHRDRQTGKWLYCYADADGHEFYLFGKNLVEHDGAAIVPVTEPRDEVQMHIITRDLRELDSIITECVCFAAMSPISYAGGRRDKQMAAYHYGLEFEIDDLIVNGDHQDGLENLIMGWQHCLWPIPTYLSCSGNGLHLLYLFDRPIKFHPAYIYSMAEFRDHIVRLMWNNRVTTASDHPEMESLWQIFRVPGTPTKEGAAIYKDPNYGFIPDQCRCRVFKIGDTVSLAELNTFGRKHHWNPIVHNYDYNGSMGSSVGSEEYKKYVPIGNQNRKMYDSYLEKAKLGATGGHRGYCMDSLVITALKCSDKSKWNPTPVTYDELVDDLDDLYHSLKEIPWKRNGMDDPLTEEDMGRALSLWNSCGYIRTSAKKMRQLTALPLEPSIRRNKYSDAQERTFKKNKKLKKDGIQERGKTKQEVHLERARESRDMIYADTLMPAKPRKIDVVQQWRSEHPAGKKVDCIKDTGLSPKTVYRWWDGDNIENTKLKKSVSSEDSQGTVDPDMVADLIRQVRAMSAEDKAAFMAALQKNNH